MPNIHPLLVHFPIALAYVILAFDLFGIFSKKPSYLAAGTLLSALAAVGGAAAVISGLVAEESVSHSGAVHDLLETHEMLGFIFLGIITVMAIIRLAIGQRLVGRLVWIVLLLNLAAAGVVTAGAYIGGEMVYRYGLGVAAIQSTGSQFDQEQPGTIPNDHDQDDDEEYEEDEEEEVEDEEEEE